MYYIRRMRNAATLVLLTLALPAWGVIDDLTLTDERGVSHHLYPTDAKAVVLMVQGNGCPIVRSALPRLREIRADYAPRGVAFLLLNANPQDNAASVRREADEFRFDIPVLLDSDQRLTDVLDIVRTAEVFVIDSEKHDVVYRGPIDDRWSYGREKATPTAPYLRDVLDAMLTGGAIDVARRDAPGCLIRRERP